MKRVKQPIAWFVIFAFFAVVQLAAMPLGAAPAPDQAGTVVAGEEQSPAFVESAASHAPAPRKKSIVPMVLIGVGVAAAAAVLFLVVLKTKYDARGTWTLTRSSEFYWITNPRTFVFAGASRDSGTMTISGFADGGPWSVDGKKITFTATTTGSYLWTFTGEFTGKDSMSGTVNYHDASHDINGTWSATRAAAAPAALPRPGADEKIPELDRR